MPKLLSPPPLEDWGFGVSSIMPMERLLQVGMKPRSSPVKSGENRLTRTAQGSTTHSTLLLPRLMPIMAKPAQHEGRPESQALESKRLRPRIYRTAVARLLGQPLFSSSAPCPLCEQTMDPPRGSPFMLQ